jgi:hypothetical protein
LTKVEKRMESAENTRVIAAPSPKCGRDNPAGLAALARNSADPEVIARSKRSQATNGTRYFAVGGVGNSAWTRRFRDLNHAYQEDKGGADHISAAQKSLIRRVATLEVELESMEAVLSEGGYVDIELYGRITGHLRRVLETLGLERKARDANEITLRTYTDQMQRSAYRFEGRRADAEEQPADVIDRPAADLPKPAAAKPHSHANVISPLVVASPSAPDPTPPAISAPPIAERPSSPVASQPTPARKIVAAPNSDHDPICVLPADPPAASDDPPMPPADPQSSAAPHRAMTWPPPEAPRRPTQIASNMPPADDPAPVDPTPEPAPVSEHEALLPSNRPR